MKILAIETEITKLNVATQAEILRKEAEAVFHLQQNDILREIYFDENYCAVLILECSGKSEAEKILSALPLVKHGAIDFQILELQPYTGFSRLISS